MITVKRLRVLGVLMICGMASWTLAKSSDNPSENLRPAIGLYLLENTQNPSCEALNFVDIRERPQIPDIVANVSQANGTGYGVQFQFRRINRGIYESSTGLFSRRQENVTFDGTTIRQVARECDTLVTTSCSGWGVQAEIEFLDHQRLRFWWTRMNEPIRGGCFYQLSK
jgi:hypothetical protein